MGHRYSHVGQETVLVRSVLAIIYRRRGAPRAFIPPDGSKSGPQIYPHKLSRFLQIRTDLSQVTVQLWCLKPHRNFPNQFYQVNGAIIYPYAFVDVQIEQETNSLEIVTEIDPLDVGEILGSIGGFWGGFYRDPTYRQRHLA